MNKKEESLKKVNYILKSNYEEKDFHKALVDLFNSMISESLNRIIKDFLEKYSKYKKYEILSDDGFISVISVPNRCQYELNYMVFIKSREIKLKLAKEDNKYNIVTINPKKTRYFFISPEDSLSFDAILNAYQEIVITPVVLNLTKEIVFDIYNEKEINNENN